MDVVTISNLNLSTSDPTLLTETSLPSLQLRSDLKASNNLVAPWNEPRKVLRVALPNSQSTVIQVELKSSIAEILNQIAIKRSLDPSMHIIKLVFEDGETVVAEMDRLLDQYEDVKSVIMEAKNTKKNLKTSNNLLSLGRGFPSTELLGSRRKSVINAPSSKQLSVRLDTEAFPRTVTDQHEIAKYLCKDHDTAIQQKFKGFSRNLSSLLWKKGEKDDCCELELHSPTDTIDRTHTVDSSNETVIVNTSSSTYMHEQSLVSLNGGLTLRRLSRKVSRNLSMDKCDSTFSRDSSKDSNYDPEKLSTMVTEGINEAFEVKKSDSGDIKNITLRALQRSSSGDNTTAITSKVGRKRTSSNSYSSSLRRTLTRGGSRANTNDLSSLVIDSDSPLNNNSPALSCSTSENPLQTLPLSRTSSLQTKFFDIDVLLPDKTKSTLKVSSETISEAVLKHICSKKNLDFNEHSLEVSVGNAVAVEMDRTVSYYVEKEQVKELSVVVKPKHYNVICLSEGDNDVMILQNINGRFVVMAANEEKLVERITDPYDSALDASVDYDYDFLDQFLMTYRSFMKPSDLFNYLMARFNAELPHEPTEDDIQYFNTNKGPTQHRAVQAIGMWTRKFWHDFAFNTELKNDLEEFVSEISSYDNFKEAARNIQETIEKQSEEYEKLFNEQKLISQKGKMMESMLMTLKPQDVAQCICLYDFGLFHNIHAIEYLNQIWKKKGEEDTTPSLAFFVARFDQESYWVATEICSVKDLKKRIAVLVQFIQIARWCLEYNNFFSAFSLAAGLGLRPVERLKKTWKGIPEDVKLKFDELMKFCDPSRNMKNYRDRLAAAKPPLVPFLPMYLKDLTFLNDGNESKVRGLINFDKLRMMSGRVKEICATKNHEYTFPKNPSILNYLKKPPIEKDLAKLKELSLECEADVKK